MQTHKSLRLTTLLLWLAALAAAASPSVHDPILDVTYTGTTRNGIEVFLSIPYGQDTAPPNRFKPPKPFVPTSGSTIEAQSAGPACPQQKGDPFNPLYLSNVTATSEDCLHLNVYKPKGVSAGAKLPVMLFIHGGSFIIGSKDELATQPDGLVLKSIDNGNPIVGVNINYRLGGK